MTKKSLQLQRFRAMTINDLYFEQFPGLGLSISMLSENPQRQKVRWMESLTTTAGSGYLVGWWFQQIKENWKNIDLLNGYPDWDFECHKHEQIAHEFRMHVAPGMKLIAYNV